MHHLVAEKVLSSPRVVCVDDTMFEGMSCTTHRYEE